MRFRPRASWLQLPGAVAFALLAALAFAPRKARAECGDYLMIGGHSTKAESPVKPPVQCPCNGPQCSQCPSTPMLPPVPPPTVPPAEWATVSATADALTNNHTDVVPDKSNSRSVRRSSSVFHPPRAAV